MWPLAELRQDPEVVGPRAAVAPVADGDVICVRSGLQLGVALPSVLGSPGVGPLAVMPTPAPGPCVEQTAHLALPVQLMPALADAHAPLSRSA